MLIRTLCFFALLAAASATACAEDITFGSLEKSRDAILAANGAKATPESCKAAWKRLASAPPEAMPTILGWMKGANPTAENWLRSAVDTMADAALFEGKSLPADELRDFIKDRTQSPRARRAAYEWLKEIDSTASKTFLPTMLDDPDLELRFDAVKRVITQAAAKGLPDDKRKKLLNTAINAALDQGQLNQCASRLKKLGQEVDLTVVMGFLTDWQLVGPFDNVNGKGFAVAYPPEQNVSLADSYDGKADKVQWKAAQAEGVLGTLDLTETIGPEKGAAAYAYTTFKSDKAQPAQLRYASSNATKVWLNGKLVTENEVYHAGNPVDQYRTDIQLKAGENSVLVKVCQNEQKQPWAQDWVLQLRFTDKLGKGILPAK